MTFTWRYCGGMSKGGLEIGRRFYGHRAYRDEEHRAQKETVTTSRGTKTFFYADGCKTAFKTEEDLRKYLEADAVLREER